MELEDITLGAYTHINFAFALVNPKTFRMDAMDADTARMYERVTKLKERQPGLKLWIGRETLPILDKFLIKENTAEGGWAMNDPGPYRTTFSDLVKSTSA
jgi:chitinase